MAELEAEHARKDELIESLRSRRCRAAHSPSRRQRFLQVRFQGASYEWLDLEESQALLQASDFVQTLRENIAYYFNVPLECQALYGEAGLLRTAADFRAALQGAAPSVALHDIRESVAREELAQRLLAVNAELERGLEEKDHVIEMMQGSAWVPSSPSRSPRLPAHDGRRMLFVEFQGRVYEWFDLDEHCDLAGDAEHVLRSNIAHYFGLPPERQVLWDEHGPIASPNDFRRLFEEAAPVIQLREVSPVLEEPSTTGLPCRSVSFGDWDLAGPTVPEPLARIVHSAVVPSVLEVELLLSRGADSKGFGFAVVPVRTASTAEPVATWGDGRALALSWIDDWGLLARWNRICPDRALQPGDVLLSVNGRQGGQAMREELLASETVQIRAWKGPGACVDRAA